MRPVDVVVLIVLICSALMINDSILISKVRKDSAARIKFITSCEVYNIYHDREKMRS